MMVSCANCNELFDCNTTGRCPNCGHSLGNVLYHRHFDPSAAFGLSPLKQEGGSFCHCGASAAPGEELIHEPGCEPLTIRKQPLTDRVIDWLFSDNPMPWWKVGIMTSLWLACAGLGIWLFKVAVQFFANCDC